MATQATGRWYLKGIKNAFLGVVDWEASPKLLLASASWTPNQDANEFRSDVSNQISGTNWAAGGVAIPNPVVVIDATANTISLDGDQISVAAVTVVTAVKNMAIYDPTSGVDTTDPLIGYIILDSAITPTGETFVITPPSVGWLTGAIAT